MSLLLQVISHNVVCGKCFTQSSLLKTCELIHTGDKPYCRLWQTYYLIVSLKDLCLFIQVISHIVVCGKCLLNHLSLRPVSLLLQVISHNVVCGKCFTQSSLLKTCELIHTGDKPYCQLWQTYYLIVSLKDL